MRNDYQLQSAISRNTHDLTVRHLIDIMLKIENLISVVGDDTVQARELIEWANTLQHIIETHITLEELTYVEESGLLD